MSHSRIEMNRNQRQDGSNIQSGPPPARQATHIANCMRQEVDWTGRVYVLDETSSSSTEDTTAGRSEQVPGPVRPVTKSTSFTRLFKYQLSRSNSKRTKTPMATFFIDSKDQALAIGRSPTSLSDTATVVSPNTVGHWPPRGGSLSRRRNISVPELKGKADASAKITYEGTFADSPTIPGRPPIKRANSEMHGHERSSSAPGSWRENPFGEAMLSAVAGPQMNGSPGKLRPYHKATPADQSGSYLTNRPLSPIFSPVATTPVTAVPRLLARSPSPSDSPGSVLSPDFRPEDLLPETPPPVPPKHRPGELGSPVRANTMVKRTPSTKSHSRSKTSSPDLKAIPPLPVLSIQPPARPAPSPPIALFTSPTSKSDRGVSPQRMLVQTPERRIGSPDSSTIDKQRHKKFSLRKQKSAPILPKVALDMPAHDPKTAALLASTVEPEIGETSIPTGVKPVEAVLILPTSEKDIIRRQAQGQVEHFEILGSKIVMQLSKELRALDERCEYLRKTYKSLRAGRQRLHNRMIAYLKSDSLIFSKERLLKQQEALIELDASIDDWITKLERAENRRLRLRQKLLEHVAASMTLSTPTKTVHNLTAPATPPRSPLRPKVAETPKAPIERKDVESIKIYADNQVLSLFNDIEQVVTKMCEAC